MILVTGASGFLGQHVVAKLLEKGLPHFAASHEEADLIHNEAVVSLFDDIAPTHVIHCAAYVGGISFNRDRRADIFHCNMSMTVNLLQECARSGVRRLVLPIANCAYPGNATLFRESEFWDGPLHDSVRETGFTRKAMVAGAQAYREQYGLDSICLVLPNLYGPHDHFDADRSHALGALVAKIMKAKRDKLPSVEVWGTGKPIREWMYVEDAAEAMVRAIDVQPTTWPLVNVGRSNGISVARLAGLICEAVGYEGTLFFNTDKPDGAPCKTIDGTAGKALLGIGGEVAEAVLEGGTIRPVSMMAGIQKTVAWVEAHPEVLK